MLTIMKNWCFYATRQWNAYGWLMFEHNAYAWPTFQNALPNELNTILREHIKNSDIIVCFSESETREPYCWLTKNTLENFWKDIKWHDTVQNTNDVKYYGVDAIVQLFDVHSKRIRKLKRKWQANVVFFPIEKLHRKLKQQWDSYLNA